MATDGHIERLLRALLNGDLTAEETAARLREQEGDLNVPGIARLDLQRRERTGFPEVILAAGKSVTQLTEIVACLASAQATNVVVSRISREQWAALTPEYPDAVLYELSGTAVFQPAAPPSPKGAVAIVTGGTSDLAIAEEAEVMLRIAGSQCTLYPDAGIAGLHRIVEILPALREMRVIICVAGMEAALPSVVAGLLPVPVIGLPTSIGYGINSGGYNALASILGSCVPGVATVNIDNGIGAAALAHRINYIERPNHD